MPVYEEKLICPFAVKFSQKHIRTTFRDGRLVEDTISEIEYTEGLEDYDLILKAPFPHIEIARWRPKGTEQDGRHWFTLDNRRLYCLQRAAAAHWPKTVAVVVQILYNDGGSMRKKYDSVSCGQSVSIAHSLKSSEISRWDWFQECVVKRTGTSTVRAARVTLSDDDKEVVDDLHNTPDDSGSLSAGAVDTDQHELQSSRQVSEACGSADESEAMFELARRCGNIKQKHCASASRLRSKISDSSVPCLTPSTMTEDTDGDSGVVEDSSSDNGNGTTVTGSQFGYPPEKHFAYGGYGGYGLYAGNSDYEGYGSYQGNYNPGSAVFNPNVAMLNLQAQQAAIHAHMVAVQQVRFQAMGLEFARTLVQMQAAQARPARGRVARSKKSFQ